MHPLHPEPTAILEPVGQERGRVVPVLTTTIYSMLKNASTNRMYDVVVLERNITDENKRYIRQFFARFSNALIRFFDVNRYLAGFNLTTSNAHISIETY